MKLFVFLWWNWLRNEMNWAASSIKKSKLFFNSGIVGYKFSSQLQFIPPTQFHLFINFIFFINTSLSFSSLSFSCGLGPAWRKRMKRERVPQFVNGMSVSFSLQINSTLWNWWKRERAANGMGPHKLMKSIWFALRAVAPPIIKEEKNNSAN